MLNWMNQSQAGIKVARLIINSHRYEDDTSLMAESKEELKSLLMRRGNEKMWLKTKHSKNYSQKYSPFMASSPTIHDI